MGSKISEEGFKAESNFVADAERKAQTQAALDLADKLRKEKIEEQRVKQLEEQAEADRITQLKKDAEARSAARAKEAADPNFDIALWYAQLATDDTLEGRLASLRELDLQVFDPDGDGAFEGYGLPDAVGVTRGDYLEEELGRPEQAVNRDWAEDQALGMPFIEMTEKSGVSVVSKLSEPFEVDYPYEYDNNNLYMKLPPTGGTLDLTQGFSSEERKMYLDLEARGQFIDTSNGLAGAGEYTMMWVEDPPEESGWHKFLNNPALNLAAALIPGGPQALAIVKGVSGMTLHASDWFAMAGGYEVIGQKFEKFAADIGAHASAATGGSKFVAQAVEQGTLNSISAIITDQDPLEAFITGGVQVGVGRVLGKINELTDGAIDRLEGSGQFTEDTRVYGPDGKGGTEVIRGSAPISVGSVAKKLITEAIASQLATGDINEARMASIVSAAAITADTVGNIVGERLPPGGIEMLTRSLQTTLTTMAVGGSGSEAFQRSMAAQLERATRQSLQNGTFAEDVAEIWDRAGGSYDVLYEQAANADTAANNRAEAAQQVNKAVESINKGADELSELANAATDILDGRFVKQLSAEEVDAYEAAMKAYNTAEAAFTELLDNDYMPSLDAGNAAYEAATTAYDTAVGLYESTRDGMSEASQNLTEELAPFIKDINEHTVNSLNPDFDAKFYAEQNGITVEEANSHYLTEGLYNNLAVNQTALDAQYATSVNNALNKVAETTGLNLMGLPPKQMKDVIDSLVETADAAGVPIKDLDVESVVKEALSAADNPDGIGEEFFRYTDNGDGTATVQHAYAPKGFGKAAGVTKEDVEYERAVLMVNPYSGKVEYTIPYSSTYSVNGNIIQYDPETEKPYLVNQDGGREDYSFLENDPSTSGSPTIPDSAPTVRDVATPEHHAHSPESFTSFVNDSGIVDNLIKNDDGTFAPDPDSDAGTTPEWLLNALNNAAVFLEEGATFVEETTRAEEAADKAEGKADWEIERELLTHPQNAYAILVSALQQGAEAIGGLSDRMDQEYGGVITQFSKDLQTIAEGSKTQEYKDAIERSDRLVASLPPATDDPNTPIVYYEEDQYTRTNYGVYRTAKKGDYWYGNEAIGTPALIHGIGNVLTEAVNDPNVFLGQKVFPEVPTELINFFVGSKVKLGSEAILKGLSSVKGLGLTDDIIKSVSTKFGLAAAASMDVGESVGATFTGTYEQAYATKVKMLGLEADKLQLKGEAKQRYIESFYQETTDYALLVATKASFIAGLSTTAMLVAGGAELDKYFLDGKVPDEILPLWKEILSGAEARLKAVGGEGLSESGEEFLVSDYVNGELHLIDPSINISEENGVAIAYGGLIGSSTASILTLGADAFNAITTAEPPLPPGTTTAIASNQKAAEVFVSMIDGDGSYSPEEAQDILYRELNGATTAVANVMDRVYDNAYTSTAEATSILDSSGLSYTYEDVTALIGGADGKYTPDANLDDTLDSYWAMTYGNENDTDGDGVPNNQDNEPNNPDLSNINYDAEAGESTYTDDDGSTVVVDQDGNAEVFNPDGTPVVDPEVQEEVQEEMEEGIADDVAAVEEAILEKVAENEEAGAERDQALSDAISTVADELGTTEEALLEQIGTTEEALAEDIAGVAGDVAATEEAILEKVAENEEAGIERDQALSDAISEVATELGTTEEAILEQIGTTEQTLLEQIGTTEESLIDRFDTGINEVASFIGKPAKDVTEADIDFVTDVIAQQEVLSDPTSFVPTDQQLQYDVNNDGIIDINDQTMLEQAFGGQDVALSGQFGATGLYAYNDAIAAQQKLEAEQRAAQQKLEAEQQFEQEQEIAQQQQLEIQTQIDQNQKMNMFDTLAREQLAMQAAQPTVATTKKMGLADIGPQYQFDTIFANRQQEQAYGTPFGGYGPSPSPLGRSPFDVKKASGGIIEDSTDRLLKIIGEG